LQHMERFAAAPVRRVDEAALTALKEVNPSVVVLRDTAETAAVQVFEQAAAALQGEFVFAAVAEADGDGSARRISIERNAAWLQSEGAGLNATVLYDEPMSVDALTKVRTQLALSHVVHRRCNACCAAPVARLAAAWSLIL
jgi:hypothetical protein